MGEKLIKAVHEQDLKTLQKIRDAAKNIHRAQPPGNLKKFYHAVQHTAQKAILIINL